MNKKEKEKETKKKSKNDESDKEEDGEEMEEDEEEEDDYEESGDGGEGFGGEEYIMVLHSVKNDRSKHMMGDKSVSTLQFNPFLKKTSPPEAYFFQARLKAGGGGGVN